MGGKGVIELAPGAGAAHHVMGIPFITKAGTEDTRGAYFLTEVTIEGDGPPLHRHTGDDEAFFVLEGEMGLQVEDQKRTAVAGSFHLVPRGTAHTIWNAGPTPVRALLVFAPGETQQFVHEADGVGAVEEIVAIAAKNGMEVIQD